MDLTKAFDRVLRELLFGFPISGKDNPRQYLQNLGVAEEQASWICDWIEEKGPLFTQWGVHPKLTQLLCNLHDGAWLAYADLCSVILCPRGGRQGCGSGPLVFNSVYSIATAMVRDTLAREGHTSQWTSAESSLPWWTVSHPAPCDCQGHAPASGWQGSRTRAHDSGGHIFC